MFNLKEMVKDRKVTFVCFRKNNLWYKIEDSDFTFPVPIMDIGDAEFKFEDKAILFMRYIRRHQKLITEGGN